MACGAFWQQIGELDRVLRSLRIHGLGEGTAAYQEIWKIRGRVFGKLGLKLPREVNLILRLLALSPGTILLWHDVESGWMTEARARPGAPPVYRRATDEVAVALLKGELTHELELQLMTPDDYVGE